MELGVGLPNTLAGATPALLLDWARHAEAGPFASLGVFDRLLYHSYDPLIALAAAAGSTTRIQLATMIVIGPLRSDAALAKETATLDAISGGRLTLGLAIGARRDDYAAAGVPFAERGRRLDEQIAALRAYWDDDRIGPQGRAGGPPILVGGLNDGAFARAARLADGYVHGGGPPRAFAGAAAKARAAWIDAGRTGAPQIWGQGYYALGDDRDVEAGRAYLLDYYSFTGPFAERIAAGLLTTPQAIVQFARGYAEAGCDHLILFPTIARPDQLDRLAEVIG
jgi:alkanesulfonate monooxygenase SsuD/methylene tetrahydromethanopterin reductase-like flavin-dependent oxidoreductase (luciferase family)